MREGRPFSRDSTVGQESGFMRFLTPQRTQRMNRIRQLGVWNFLQERRERDQGLVAVGQQEHTQVGMNQAWSKKRFNTSSMERAILLATAYKVYL